MIEPVRLPAGSASAFHAAQLVRLLAATVDVVVDGWDALASDLALRRAVEASAAVFGSLAPPTDPEALLPALERLAEVVAGLEETAS
jgi:hypothetical protein